MRCGASQASKEVQNVWQGPLLRNASNFARFFTWVHVLRIIMPTLRGTPPALHVSQVKTILSVLLREYDIEMVGELPPTNFEAMVVGPKGKCNVRYTKKTA